MTEVRTSQGTAGEAADIQEFAPFANARARTIDVGNTKLIAANVPHGSGTTQPSAAMSSISA
jgi:hypothetical protein